LIIRETPIKHDRKHSPVWEGANSECPLVPTGQRPVYCAKLLI